MSKKYRQKSVGIQSTDFFNEENEGGKIRITLQKKPGFRNLLQKSVTIITHQNEKENIHYFSGKQRSKSVQAALESEVSYHTARGLHQNVKSFTNIPSDRNFKAGISSPRLNHLNDHRTLASNPGPSGIMAGGFSSESVASQMNNYNLSRKEGSLAVVYSYGEREASTSVTSTIFYGSQGSRRFSDETVLLIEDYQSYDQANAVRRQDLRPTRRSFKQSYTKNSRRNTERNSSDALAKPLHVSFERIEEIVCRICHEGEEIEPLIKPCLCKGSVGCVHASCLKVWLEQSNTSRCELCNYPYAIRQTRKYGKWVSVRVFYRRIIDRRALIYDVMSLVVITPLTLVAVAMCIQASVVSAKESSESNYQIGYITKVGMSMLCGTIIVAYGVWLYTLISFHYRSWKKWYRNCYDVEVIPIRMTSEERIEAAKRFQEEMSRRHYSREHGSIIVTVPH